jgi:hypothetical protein
LKVPFKLTRHFAENLLKGRKSFMNLKSTLALLSLMFFSTAAFAAPSLLIVKNQFGEQSNFTNVGPALPLAGAANVIIMNGATAPVDGTTGDNIAAKGSLYIARDSGVAYSNTGTITNPAWTSFAASNAGGLLTGLSVSAALLASSDTVLQGFNKLGALQNGTFVPTSQTLAAAGAVSTTSMVTLVNNASGGSIAITLAAPSSQDGQLKVIKFGTATNSATLACTNIAFSGAYTPTGTTTLTFSVSGQSAVFMAVGTKWVYLGGSAVAS